MKRFSSLIMVLIAVALVAAPASGQLVLTVKNGANVTASFTRPANSTAYAAQDIVSDSSSGPSQGIVFQLDGKYDGQMFAIKQATMTADTNNVANGTFDLHLFADTVSAGVDNAAFNMKSADVVSGKYLGKVAFTLGRSGTSGTVAVAHVSPGAGSVAGIQGKLANGKQTIYGILVATAAYQPKWAGTFTLQLLAEYQ